MSNELCLGRFGESFCCARVELFPKSAKVTINVQFLTWSREAYRDGDKQNRGQETQAKFDIRNDRRDVKDDGSWWATRRNSWLFCSMWPKYDLYFRTYDVEYVRVVES